MVFIFGAQKKFGITLLISAALFVIVGIIKVFPSASHQGYAPEQPIPFSHKRHVAEQKIPCLYCHSEAEKSRHAGVPALNVCMNCHSVVKVDSPYIQKLKKAFSEGKPIEWVRVHELPDHVYFSHKRHLAKGVACETCHGNVQAMVQIEQKEAMTMGWCMECHRGQTTPQYVLKNIYPKQKAPHGPVAPVSCNTCHN